MFSTANWVSKESKHVANTYPIIQAPPVTNATTGFGPSLSFGKYRSSLHDHIFIGDSTFRLINRRVH